MKEDWSEFVQGLLLMMASLSLNIEVGRVLTDRQKRRVRKEYNAKNRELVAYMKRHNVLSPLECLDVRLGPPDDGLVVHWIHHLDILGHNRKLESSCKYCRKYLDKAES